MTFDDHALCFKELNGTFLNNLLNFPVQQMSLTSSMLIYMPGIYHIYAAVLCRTYVELHFSFIVHEVKTLLQHIRL